VTTRKYLVLLIVILCAACGDVTLSRGMRNFGAVTLANLPRLYTALLDPWIVIGILMLIGFFASYLSALSWADLTYVLPATSLSYILMVLLAKFFLHEHVTALRWLGVALIVAGVGFVAGGPEATPGAHRHNQIETVYGPVGAIGEVADTGSGA